MSEDLNGVRDLLMETQENGLNPDLVNAMLILVETMKWMQRDMESLEEKIAELASSIEKVRGQ